MRLICWEIPFLKSINNHQNATYASYQITYTNAELNLINMTLYSVRKHQFLHKFTESFSWLTFPRSLHVRHGGEKEVSKPKCADVKYDFCKSFICKLDILLNLSAPQIKQQHFRLLQPIQIMIRQEKVSLLLLGDYVKKSEGR